LSLSTAEDVAREWLLVAGDRFIGSDCTPLCGQVWAQRDCQVFGDLCTKCDRQYDGEYSVSIHAKFNALKLDIQS
jgi:hypothetical protein